MLKKFIFLFMVALCLISPAQAINIIFVTDVPDRNADGIMDDQGWIDWLLAEGYNVDARRSYWNVLDFGKKTELKAADLIIVSPGADPNQYNQSGEATEWYSQINTPIINLNIWLARKDYWLWMNSADVRTDAGCPLLLAQDPTHPIFAGVSLDSNNMVQILDPNVGSGNTPFLNDIYYVFAGELIATTVPGTYDTTWIAEWRGGVESYGGSLLFSGGKRLLFSAGAQDFSTQGAFNLNTEGQKILRNAIEYMYEPPENLVHQYTFEDGRTTDTAGSAHGILIGDATIINGSLVLDGVDDWMEMPGDEIAINTYPELTIEVWFTSIAGGNTGYHMIAAFGEEGTGAWAEGGYKYLFITPAREDDVSRAAISTYSMDSSPYDEETGVSDVNEHDDGLEHHFVCTVNATDLAFYIDGTLIGSEPLAAGNEIAGISQAVAYLGKSLYSNEPEWAGSIEEFNIYGSALSSTKIRRKYRAGPTKPQQVILDNFSFEQPGTTTITDWNGNGTPAIDVPGWSSDTPATDSGVESDWPGSTDGVWSAFLTGTDPSVYHDPLVFMIYPNDEYILYVDARDKSTDPSILPAQLEMTFFYDMFGSRVPIEIKTVELTTTWSTYTLVTKIDTYSPAVGWDIGIELRNATSNATLINNSCISVDNVILLLDY